MDTTESTSNRAAQRVVEVLQAYGVQYVFGVPGAKIDAMYDALADGGPQLIVCRHEQNAAFMAAAVGRLTGTPGAVLVTSGPGTANLTTGLLTATTEQDPVIALCGAVSRVDRLKHAQQSFHSATLLAAVTKYTGEVSDPDNVCEALSKAIRTATTEPRGAAAVVLPQDVLAASTAQTLHRPAPVPRLNAAPPEAVAEAVRLIRSARRPVVLAGMRSGEPEASHALRALIGETELPVVETFQAAGVLPRELDHHWAGRVGVFRNLPGDVVMAHADLLLTVGYDEVEYASAAWNTDSTRTIVHLDSIPAELGNHYQPTLELRGDLAATLRQLAGPLAGLRLEPEFRELMDAQRRALAEIDLEARSASDDSRGLEPPAVVLKLRELLADDATVACDIGSFYLHMAQHFRVHEPRHLLFSNGQQTLGVGLPWAMAACLVRPGRQVASVSGDGGFLYSSAELETAVRLGLTFTHVIFRDDAYDMTRFEERLKYGRDYGVDLGFLDSAAYARSFGANGYRVSSEEELVDVLPRALAEPGPSVVDVAINSVRNIHLGQSLLPDSFD